MVTEIVMNANVTGSVDDFSALDFQRSLAGVLNVPLNLITVEAVAGSVLVTATMTLYASDVADAVSSHLTVLAALVPSRMFGVYLEAMNFEAQAVILLAPSVPNQP